MSILDQIVANKAQEIALNKEIAPVKLLERSLYFETPVVSMKTYLQREDKVGIIAEIKRGSPSNGLIKPHLNVEELSISYMQGGASALSVLTDQRYFSGSNNDLIQARKFNYCPILRKDFIIDEYQVVEAKSIGADCILLIAACLSPEQCKFLAGFAQQLGLEVLLEIHHPAELNSHLNAGIDLVGVNNRNLHDFSIQLETSLDLSDGIPPEFVKVSESGIVHPDQIKLLQQHGFQGFLIGGHFMKQAHPGKACRELVDQVQMAMA